MLAVIYRFGSGSPSAPSLAEWALRKHNDFLLAKAFSMIRYIQRSLLQTVAIQNSSGKVKIDRNKSNT